MIPSEAHHLRIGPDVMAGNDGRGRVVFVPGSLARARHIADHFADVKEHTNPRCNNVFTGTYTDRGEIVDVAAVPTGMGCPSLGIIVNELIALGARRLLRVGSSGSVQPARVHTGDVVIATGAVRDEATSDAFMPRDVPAVSHPDWVIAMSSAATQLGCAERTFRGLVHTKDALYGREFPMGPLAAEHDRYMAMLEQVGVLASEMETSHLFTLACVHGPDLTPIGVPTSGTDVVKAGSLLAIIADGSGLGSPEEVHLAEQRAIDLALLAAVQMMRIERGD